MAYGGGADADEDGGRFAAGTAPTTRGPHGGATETRAGKDEGDLEILAILAGRRTTRARAAPIAGGGEGDGGGRLDEGREVDGARRTGAHVRRSRDEPERAVGNH